MQQSILIVEDDSGILEILQYLLLDAGFLVSTSSTGKDVDALISNFRPNLVLMDIRLGQLDGREICRHIKKDISGKVPVVLMSANFSNKEALKDGCAQCH